MPPCSFVSSVYWACPARGGRGRSRARPAGTRERRCRPPAPVPCARRRRRRPRCAPRGPRRSRPRTAPASPNRRRGRCARPTRRGVRTAACAVARPAPRGLYPRARKLTACASALAARASSALIAPISHRKSNSSRRCVRIISGPSVETVTRTPASRNVRKTRAHLVRARERAGQQVGRRADLEHDARGGEQGRARGRRPRGCRGRCGPAAASPRPRRPPRRSPPRRSAR